MLSVIVAGTSIYRLVRSGAYRSLAARLVPSMCGYDLIWQWNDCQPLSCASVSYRWFDHRWLTRLIGIPPGKYSPRFRTLAACLVFRGWLLRLVEASHWPFPGKFQFVSTGVCVPDVWCCRSKCHGFLYWCVGSEPILLLATQRLSVWNTVFQDEPFRFLR